jgi:transcriptional regulator with XRE-family HTH domain
VPIEDNTKPIPKPGELLLSSACGLLTPSSVAFMIRGHVSAREQEPIGVRLRRLRLERSLSQRELAGPGVSYAYISRIEAGTRRPSVKALRTLARSLGVSPEYLETGSELRDVDERELRLADADLRLRISGEPEVARDAFATLLREAEEVGDSVSAVRARIGLGLAASQLNDPSATVTHLQEAVDSGLITPVDRPDAFSTLSRAYTLIGQDDRAIELLEWSLHKIDEDDPQNVSAYVRFAGYLSAALTDLSQLERAEHVLTDALDRAEGVSDPYTRVRIYWSVARLAEAEGRSVRALDYARRAVALLEATEDTQHLARAHLLCAWIMGLEQKADEAVPHLEKAEALLGGSGDPTDMAMLRVEQAKVAALLGSADEAIARAREALEVLGEHHEQQRGSAFWALAEGLALEGDVGPATDAFRQAVEALDRTSAWREAAQCCRRWAKVLRETGRDAEALDALERATDYAVRSHSTHQAPLQR